MNKRQFIIIAILLAVVAVITGLATRPLWQEVISLMNETPISYAVLLSGIGLIILAAVHFTRKR